MDRTLQGQGSRVSWADAPAGLHRLVEQELGARIVGFDDRAGGFSPGPAALLALEDGRRVFCKAVGHSINAFSTEIHRTERRIAGHLPAAVPAPRMLCAIEAEVDGDPWCALVFEAVDGATPQLPWQDVELELVCAALERLASTTVPDDLSLPRSQDVLVGGPWWPKVDEGSLAGLAAFGATAEWIRWAARHAPTFGGAERDLSVACAGDRLVHADLRADNVLLSPAVEGGVVLVDWPRALVGAPFVDTVLFAVPTSLQGGGTPESILRRVPSAAASDPTAIDALIAEFAGLLLCRAVEPPPPGLPTLRSFQAVQAIAATAWLAERLEVEPPPV